MTGGAWKGMSFHWNKTFCQLHYFSTTFKRALHIFKWPPRDSYISLLRSHDAIIRRAWTFVASDFCVRDLSKTTVVISGWDTFQKRCNTDISHGVFHPYTSLSWEGKYLFFQEFIKIIWRKMKLNKSCIRICEIIIHDYK